MSLCIKYEKREADLQGSALAGGRGGGLVMTRKVSRIPRVWVTLSVQFVEIYQVVFLTCYSVCIL